MHRPHGYRQLAIEVEKLAEGGPEADRAGHGPTHGELLNRARATRSTRSGLEPNMPEAGAGETSGRRDGWPW